MRLRILPGASSTDQAWLEMRSCPVCLAVWLLVRMHVLWQAKTCSLARSLTMQAAADMCVAAGQGPQAAELLIRAGALSRAAPLVAAAGAAQLHAAFAQACEGAYPSFPI